MGSRRLPERAVEEYRKHEAWWKKEKPRMRLPSKLERLLENRDSAFIEEIKKFAIAYVADRYQVLDDKTGRYKHYPLCPDLDLDQGDGSWLWTLYLRNELLAKDALRQLLEYIDYNELSRIAELLAPDGKPVRWWLNDVRLDFHRGFRYTPIAFTPIYFRYIKGIYKLAEQRRDDKIWSILAYRFDVEKDFDSYIVSEEQGERVHSSVYSAKTHHYLRRRSWRTLRNLGRAGSSDYVRLATELLLCYSDQDAKTVWIDGKTAMTNESFTHLWVLNHILYHHSDRFIYTGNKTWKAVGDWTGWTAEKREEAFPELWDQHPESLWKLFTEGKATPVIEFAGQALLKGNRSFVKKIPLSELRSLLRSFESARKKWATRMLLERLAHPDVRNPDLDTWFSLSIHSDCVIREATFQFFLQYHKDWTDEQCLQLLKRFIEQLQSDSEIRPEVIEDWSHMIQNHLSDVLSRVATIDLAQEMAESNQSFLHELAGAILEKIEFHKHPFTGDQLLPFLKSEHPTPREVARRILSDRFTQLQLDGRFLAEFASIPGEEHQVYVTQFFTDRLLWLVPHLPELLHQLWVRVLRSDTPEEVQDYIRKDLLGSLFFNELVGHTSLDKVLKLLNHDQTSLQELGARLFEAMAPGPEDVTLGELLRLAHCPVALARQEARRLIIQKIEQVNDEMLVNLAETEWDDTRNWVLDYLNTRSSDEINPDLIYGLLDTSRNDIQQFAMHLVRIHEKRLDLMELMLRAGESPHLAVQEYALQLAEKMEWTPETVRHMELFFRTVLLRVHSGRKAKEQALRLLMSLGKQRQEMAEVVVPILADVCHNFGKRDFEQILMALTQMQARYPEIRTPITIR
ncbi:hypothetical protein [Melghirimyces algeriensis]|uniref:HEAT repeat-containing protein n=1 Tax=Melghirimyces algeriensis TaxID=910412 RepID=A0A521CU95_9BACL|nr:hypothetical protein [Melghirimyces algeriensis]SMO63008.1 hypothetical protein SAMN06264849_104192 [Melghirimyces algeriensis]